MMDTMSKSGKSSEDTTDLKLICDHTCGQHYKFVQQAGWKRHFLIACDCKEIMYFRIPEHIPEPQYRTYMKLSTTYKNKLVFCRGKF
jgi:hypothetical protein